MQTENGQDNKVVSIANRTPKNATTTQSEQKQESFSWEEIQRRNEENRLRLKREREKANKGVIRSYRLKH
ncbi:hypothetical protein [Oligoflexus tunisiensis]|uniref:hypothetical protein n=1 Tax=Oligoflexus tunisiensis TaxID=708132 RepID=UPI00114CA0F9|nr:hypothetical protein [Oligoflexus tunisiensis]